MGQLITPATTPTTGTSVEKLQKNRFRAAEPAIRRLIILAILFGQMAYHFSWMNVHLDNDLWWHLATGRWIVQHGSVPSTDPFSEYGQTRPWVAYTWLFDLLVLKVHDYAGYIGIEYLKITLGLAFALVLYFLLQRLAASFGLAVMLTVAALLAALPLATPRPWLFTMVFFALELLVLTRLRNDRRRTAIWFLPIMFALWSNLHVQFIYGLILIGIFLAEGLQERFMRSANEYTGNWRAARLYGGLLCLCAVAACLNPYGSDVYRTVWDYANQGSIYMLIQELSPPHFRSATHWLFIGLVLSAVIVTGRRRTTSVLPYLFLAFGLCSALRMQRDAWLAALAGAAVLAGWPSGRSTVESPSDPEWTPPPAAVIGVALATLMVVLAVAGISARELEKEVSTRFPVKAVDFISSRSLTGPIYNDFGWGGYLTWRLPAIPVSMDGRTNVHRPERIIRSFRVWNGQPDWREDTDLRKARLVLAPKNLALTSILRLDREFQAEYEDDLSVVFVRRAKK